MKGSNTINQKIGKATAWSSITEIVAKLISPIVNIILARLLAPEAFGLVATITMVISFAEVFTDAGFQKYIIQHEFKDEEALNKSTNVAFWTNFSLSIFVCIIIFIFRHNIATFVGNSELGNSISIASLLIIIVAFSSIQAARCKRDFDFKTLFFARIGSSLIPLIITIPLAVILKNYWALLIGNMASNLFTAIILTIKSKWKPSFFYDFKLFKEMFSFSAWTLLESISIWLTLNIGTFIVGNYLDDYYLGLYKTSIATINSYMSIITSAIIPVLFSGLSRYQNDEENFQKTYYTFQRIVAIFILPMGAGVFIFSDLVTKILLGSQWMEASGFIGLWGATSAIIVLFSNFASEAYRSKGNPKVSLFAQLSHLIFIVPAILISIDYGFQCLYITRSLIRVELVIFNFIVMRILYKFKFRDLLKNIFPMLISTLIMGLAGYGLEVISENILWQIVAVVICIVIYFVSLFLIFPKTRKEIFEMKAIKKMTNKLFKKRKSSKPIESEQSDIEKNMDEIKK